MMGAQNTASPAKPAAVWRSGKSKDPYFETLDGKPNKSVAVPPFPVEGFGNYNFSNLGLVGFCVALPWLALRVLGLYSPFAHLVLFLITCVPGFAAYNYMWNFYLHYTRPYNDAKAPLPGRDIEYYMDIKDPELKARFHHRNRIPMELFFEGYIAGKIDIKGDVLECFEARYDFTKFEFCLGQAKFLFGQWIPEVLWHSRKQDEDQVQGHYDRGDDFYEAVGCPERWIRIGRADDILRSSSAL